jgi:hypothetical protein
MEKGVRADLRGPQFQAKFFRPFIFLGVILIGIDIFYNFMVILIAGIERIHF